MFKHYIKTSVRYLFRNKTITLINIVGLSIGVAIFILIMHYVRDELSYDKFNDKLETVGRIEFLSDQSEGAWTTSAMGYDVVENVPEAIAFVRFHPWGSLYLDYNENKYEIQAVAAVDSNVFDLFNLELIQGDPKSALRDPATVVLTQSLANKIFGNQDPVGKVMKSSGGREFMITGVIKDPPNFHQLFDMLVSFVTLGVMYGEDRLYNYKTYQYSTYIEIIEGADPDSVNKKVDAFFHKKFYEEYGETEDESAPWRAHLRPLKEVYFARNVRDAGSKHGNLQFVYIFIIIAGFIILIACINFINLSTARASLRAMEVGIKKVAGSGKNRLILQFLGESILITFLATLLGLLLVELLFPEFENIIGADLRIAYLENPVNLLIILVGIIVLGVTAGLYPAFYLTAFQPVSVLKGEKTKGRSAGILRKALIIFQFSISILLIIGTIIVYKQLHYMKNKDLGFRKEQIVTFELNREIRQKEEMFKENLLRYPQIEKVSFSYTVPGIGGDNYESFSLGGKSVNPVVYPIDPDYVDLMKIELLEGRNFSWDLETDRLNTCLINEQLARELDMDSLIGKKFDHPEWYITVFPVTQFEIIGILKDFHYKSLRQPVGPLIFGWNEGWFGFVNVRIGPDNIAESLKIIEKEWKALTPQYPFEYSFMDENFDNMYKSEDKLGKIFRYFAGLAIFIAILGLFGLAAFTAEQRTKEVGIRKAMGATVSRISFILVREFSWLVLISSLIAWPVAWFGTREWLKEFAYKTNVGIDIFIIATLIALLVALITVISQTLKTANTNPAESLRYE